jgi:post-segregation antitoxin (ccd killing protein)
MRLFLDASANLGQSLQGFRKQLGYLRKIADLSVKFKEDLLRDAKDGKIYTSDMSDEEVAAAIRFYQDEWQRNNPFLTEEDRSYLNQEALKSTKEASAWRKGYLDRISKQQKQSSVDVSDRF